MKRQQPLRILLYGAECTGKSTLGQALARHYQCQYVAEYARTYAEQKLPAMLEEDDAIEIARGQARAEAEAYRQAAREEQSVVIVDTDARMSWMYCELFFDHADPWIVHRALHMHYDLVIFTAQDQIPWQTDPVRSPRDPRFIQTGQLRYLLQMTGHLNEPLLPVSGTIEQRLAKSIAFIDTLLHARKQDGRGTHA